MIIENNNTPAIDSAAKSKQQHRLDRQRYREMKHHTSDLPAVDCACVIHGSVYTWDYVERLYSMLIANSSRKIRMHVFTEPERVVPSYMIKHVLEEWPGISGPKKSWWYKMQMFDSNYIPGRVFYLDLDTVVVGNIDWIWELSDDYFWAIRDFKYLWRPGWHGLNSSVMTWNTTKFDWIWRAFRKQDIVLLSKKYHGDQDYLDTVLTDKHLRFIADGVAKSWRWQCKDGGMDMKSRQYRSPGSGTSLAPDTKIVVFHGHPKPHELADPLISQLWKLTSR
jgi:hypothetical protein